jgi:hypothetical protein
VGARPDSDTASNFPATYSLAKSFGERQAESFEVDISGDFMFFGSVSVNRSKRGEQARYRTKMELAVPGTNS